MEILRKREQNNSWHDINRGEKMSKVLIVVDMQNDFIDGALGTKEAVAIVPYVKEVIENFEGKVFFTRDTHFDGYMETQEGKNLPVSTFVPYVDGTTPSGAAAFEKRGIAIDVPEWNPENCIQCNKCAFVCPHAVIRPYLLNEEKDNIETLDSLFPKDKKYTLAISYENCTGCGLCVNSCPGKNDEKALTMIENKDVEFIGEKIKEKKLFFSFMRKR